MAKDGWYQKGGKGHDRSVVEDKAAKDRRDNNPFRFRQKNDASAKIVFLDNPDFFLNEHTIKLGDKKFEQETCIKDFDTCPLCMSGLNPSYILVATVIDTRKITVKDKVYKNVKRLFVAKSKTRQNLLRRMKKKGSLKFVAFEISRGGNAQECATGEDLDYLGKVSKEKLLSLVPKDQDAKKFLTPFDYTKIFKPKTAQELRVMYGGETPVGSEEGGGDDDDLFASEDDDLLSDSTDDTDIDKELGLDDDASDDLDDLDDPGEEEEKESVPDFDEEALRKELKAVARPTGVKGLQALKKYANGKELDIKVSKSSKKTEIITDIVEAMRPSDEGKDTGDSDDTGDLDIDDLI